MAHTPRTIQADVLVRIVGGAWAGLEGKVVARADDTERGGQAAWRVLLDRAPAAVTIREHNLETPGRIISELVDNDSPGRAEIIIRQSAAQAWETLHSGSCRGRYCSEHRHQNPYIGDWGAS